MLTIYRRHRRRCAHRKLGRKYRRCPCPIWVDGRVGGVDVRKSVGTANWEKAQELVRQWESERVEPEPPTEPTTIKLATERFLLDATSRKLQESTISKYRFLFEHIGEFAQRRGLRYIAEFDVVLLDEFRATWKDGARSSAKKLERLRGFFRFAQEREWITKNPAANLKAPKVTLRPTMPFTDEEMLRILVAADQYGKKFAGPGRENALRVRGLVLLLRYSGLRIGDAIALTVDRIRGDRLFLFTHKTGTPVNTVLPGFVANALQVMPKTAKRYFFWDGVHTLEATVGSWRRRLAKVFELAGVQDGHAHRFRDSFAVSLLLTGVPIERVSVLLGHQSVRITEKHYSPWVRSRQEQLEADLQRTWEQDPIALMETRGTQQVHANNETIN